MEKFFVTKIFICPKDDVSNNIHRFSPFDVQLIPFNKFDLLSIEDVCKYFSSVVKRRKAYPKGFSYMITTHLSFCRDIATSFISK